MARALGTDDSITTCDCCGKANLKFTVTIELDDGEVVHYGQICARRNTGKDQRTISSEIKAAKEAALTAARREYLASPEYLAERARFEERDELARCGGIRMPGMAAAEFVREAVAVAAAARNTIALKHRVSAWQL